MILVIIGLAGSIGSGKSFTQLKQALQYAEERQKQLVFNFEVNTKELYKYASMPKQYDTSWGYVKFELSRLFAVVGQQLGLNVKMPRVKPRLPWVRMLCERGGIIQIPAPQKLEALLIPESVVCLDEAGILLNSRDFANTSKQLLADLAQSRKDGCDLFWAAQFDEQVDRQLRLLTQYWIHCDSLAVYDKKLRRPKLFWKKVYWFRASDYNHWQQNVRDRGSHFKARFAYGFKYEGGLLTAADKQIFNIFNSFARLDKFGSTVTSKIHTMWSCELPRDYYFSRLEGYRREFDPLLLKYYQPLFGWYRPVKSLQPAAINLDRSALIKLALALARKKGVSAPYFKAMAEPEIQKFISINS